MEKVVKEYGMVILFYLFIILCVIIVNARFDYLDNQNKMESNTLAYSSN